jgi:hypothetical protein
MTVPSASEWTSEDKKLFAEMNAAAGKAMMGNGDEMVGDLGSSSMDNGKAVGVSWICEFLTETEFNRVLPAVQRALSVLMRVLNRKWGGTAVSAFQAFLILHLAFSRGAQEPTNTDTVLRLLG